MIKCESERGGASRFVEKSIIIVQKLELDGG